MNPLKNKKRLKTITALLIALLTTTTLSPRLFVADSPQINTQFIAELRNAPQDFVAFLRREPEAGKVDAVAQLDETRAGNVPEGLQFYPMAPGVQAAEDPSNGGKYVTVEAGTELTAYTITLEDGRVVTVYLNPQ